MDQVTVFSEQKRRRLWSGKERLQILSEAFARGTCGAEVCRRHIVSSALIYTSRRKLLDAGAVQEAEVPSALPAPVFFEAVVDEDATNADTIVPPAVIIDLRHGKRASIFAAAAPALVAGALKALR